MQTKRSTLLAVCISSKWLQHDSPTLAPPCCKQCHGCTCVHQRYAMSLLHQPVDHRACLEHGRLQPSGSQTNLVLHKSTVLTHAQQLALFLLTRAVQHACGFTSDLTAIMCATKASAAVQLSHSCRYRRTVWLCEVRAGL